MKINAAILLTFPWTIVTVTRPKECKTQESACGEQQFKMVAYKDNGIPTLSCKAEIDCGLEDIVNAFNGAYQRKLEDREKINVISPLDEDWDKIPK